MFGAKYNRLTFWIWSIILWIPFSVFSATIKATEMNNDLSDLNLGFRILFGMVVIMWMNALANRIRDYGSNPWIAVFALIPLVNIGLALYYGIAKYKNKPIENNTISNNSNPSLTKAVYNHSKDIANEIKPTINEYKERHSTTKNENQTTKIMNSEINEDEIYEKIMIEIEEDKKVKSTWAKALAQSDGDKNKAESIYIKMRVDEIQSEIYKNIEYLKTKEINKQKEEKFTKNIEITKDEYERINCPHCNNSTYLKEEKCLKCGKDIRKLTYHTIDKYSYYNGKKFTIENRIDNEILTKVGNNFKIVKKALDLNNNENCGLNDYLIDKNNFEYLVLKHGSYYLVISNYGILVQFNL